VLRDVFRGERQQQKRAISLVTMSTYERFPASQGKCEGVSDVVLEDKDLVSMRLEDKN